MANCSHTGLTEIPESLPKDTDWLILNGNNISSPKITNVGILYSLSRLNLKDNEIEIISEDFAKFLAKNDTLVDLEISNNNLKTIPREFEKGNIRKLNLSENRFQCRCSNLWMKNWLIENREKIQDFNTVSCQLESGRHILFIQLTNDDLTCPSTFTFNIKITLK